MHAYTHTKKDIHTKLKSNGAFINSLFRLIHRFLSPLIFVPTSLMYISRILHSISLKPLFPPTPMGPFPVFWALSIFSLVSVHIYHIFTYFRISNALTIMSPWSAYGSEQLVLTVTWLRVSKTHSPQTSQNFIPEAIMKKIGHEVGDVLLRMYSYHWKVCSSLISSVPHLYELCAI